MPNEFFLAGLANVFMHGSMNVTSHYIAIM